MAHQFQARRESVQREHIEDDRLRGNANCKFIYIHWPGQWELVEHVEEVDTVGLDRAEIMRLLDDEGVEYTKKGSSRDALAALVPEKTTFELLPRLKRPSLNPGANGVQWLPKANNDLGKVDPANLYLILERQKAVRIPANAPTVYTDGDGELYEDPEPGYLWSMELESGHKLYIDPWDNPTQRRPFGIDFGGRDMAGYRAWLRLLVAREFIPQPTPEDLEAIIRLQRRRAERHAKSAAGNPVLHRRVIHEEARLRAMLAEQKKRFVGMRKRKAPKSKGRRKEALPEPAQ